MTPAARRGCWTALLLCCWTAASLAAFVAWAFSLSPFGSNDGRPSSSPVERLGLTVLLVAVVLSLPVGLARLGRDRRWHVVTGLALLAGLLLLGAVAVDAQVPQVR